MKAKLEFDLNDSEDKMSHMRCVKSTDMAIVFFWGGGFLIIFIE